MNKIGYLTLLSAGLLCNPWQASAKTYNVGCSVDELRTAFTEVNQLAEDHVINLASACTYTLTEPQSSGGSSGVEYPSDYRWPYSLIINGNNAIIERSQADGTPKFGVMSLRPGAGSTTVKDLTIQGGHSESYFIGAGGLHVSRGELSNLTLRNNQGRRVGGLNLNVGSITDSIIENNIGELIGGADLFKSTMTRTRVSNNRSHANTESNTTSGGVYGIGKIIDSTITNNRSSHNDTVADQNGVLVSEHRTAGGIVFNGEVTNTTISNNHAISCGGALLESTSSVFKNVVSGSTIENNTADGTAGICLLGGSISDTKVRNNRSNGKLKRSAGGLSGYGKITNSTITGNSSTLPDSITSGQFPDRAGGVYLIYDSEVFKSKITSNTASYYKISNELNTQNLSLSFTDVVGGLNAPSGNINIDHSTISNNTGFSSGGIKFAGKITHSLIEGNQADKIIGVGGGINVHIGSVAETVISDTIIRNNKASLQAGGILFQGPGKLERVKVLNNEQNSQEVTFPLITQDINYSGAIVTGGGGIGCFAVENLIIINDSEIIGNTAHGTTGGGIGAALFCKIFINRSLIAKNQSFNIADKMPAYLSHMDTGTGGGIGGGYVSFTITDSAIIDNRADTVAGGLSVVGGDLSDISSSSTVKVINTTISGNTAGVRGGGIGNAVGKLSDQSNSQSGLTLINTTITNNTAPRGSGIEINDYPDIQDLLQNTNLNRRVDGLLTLKNTLISGNHGGADCYLGKGQILSNTNSLLGSDSSGANACNTGSHTFAKVGDAKLHPLGADSDAVHKQYHVPMAGSPVINAGANNAVPADVSTDQIGNNRKVGLVDIGAIEYYSGQQPPPLVTGPIIFKDSFEVR